MDKDDIFALFLEAVGPSHSAATTVHAAQLADEAFVLVLRGDEAGKVLQYLIDTLDSLAAEVAEAAEVAAPDETGHAPGNGGSTTLH